MNIYTCSKCGRRFNSEAEKKNHNCSDEASDNSQEEISYSPPIIDSIPMIDDSPSQSSSSDIDFGGGGSFDGGGSSDSW